EQLKELAKTAEFGIADSEYNRKELEAAGLANTAVVPALVDWEDFDRPPDPEVARTLADERTAILTVGQILPHKAVHDVVAAFARYRESDRTAQLYLVGPTAMSGGYLDRVRADIRRLGLDGAVTITGSITVEQLVAFSRRAVAERLKLALAQGGWDLPDARSKKVVVMSSDQRCGIHHYSLAVSEGLRDRGHQVTFVGVKHLDTADLYRKLKFISAQSDAVLIEHEAGIFRDVPFVRALLSFWRKRLPVILSLHELEPEKFHHYRRLSAALHYNPRYRLPLEILRMPWVALRMANWFLRYRLVLMFMGSIPRKLVV